MTDVVKCHPVTELFPLMPDDEYGRLVADIADNGQLEPIKTHKGQIIDGRHRYRACCELGIKPQFQKWLEVGSITAYVISLNLHRRQLSQSQKAMIADEARDFFEAEAKERLKTSTGGAEPRPVEKKPQAETGKSRDKAGKAFGVSGKMVDAARFIKQKAPEKAQEVKAGTKKISQASREIKKAEVAEKVATLPTEKYRVVYADPPWSYGNAGVIGETDNYGHVQRHYQSMAIAELCALGIKDIVDPDAVLFLWVTSPLLAECWPVITAWGFKYKASFVWDKVKHNFGHYNSVRHEFLLICTRGSCLPEAKTLHDSVVSIERSKTHSEKPEHFRILIDKLYPHGKRIELFARTKQTGRWDVYGNETG